MVAAIEALAGDVIVGMVPGITLFEALEAPLFPTALVATTVQVTATPFVRPVTTIGEAEPDALMAPHVAVYPVIADPPLLAGAVNAIDTDPSAGVAAPIVGGSGVVAVVVNVATVV